jgi:hypothetical protein
LETDGLRHLQDGCSSKKNILTEGNCTVDIALYGVCGCH